MSLVSITKVQVPAYLVGSDFYNSLSLDDEHEAFIIPRNHVKMSPEVHTPSDLRHLLHTIRFWGLDILPNELIQYLLLKVERDVGDQIIDVLEEFEPTLSLTLLFQKFQLAMTAKQRLEAAAYCQRRDVLEFLVCFGKPVNGAMVKSAAECGLFDVLVDASQELYANGKDPFANIALCNVAAAGHTECLGFLLVNGCQKLPSVCHAAAEGGHLDCLHVAHTLGCAWDGKVTAVAARRGHYDCLTYALQRGCPIGPNAASSAALHGHYDCLHLLLEFGVSLDPSIAQSACLGGWVDCLNLLLSQGCPMDLGCARAAVKMNHSTCLQLLVEHGCPLNANVADIAASLGHTECLLSLHECGQNASAKGAIAAAEGGHMSCLTLIWECHVYLTASVSKKAFSSYSDDACVRCLTNLFAVGFTLPESVNWVSVAVELRHTECVRFLLTHTNERLYTPDAVTAARNGDLSTLQVLHEHHCPWGVEASNAAAAAPTDSLAVLQFLHEHGCAWDGSTTDAALAAKNTVCLKYAIEQRCRMGPATCALFFAHRGKLSLLQHHHRSGGTFTTIMCLSAIKGGQLECLQYCVTHGALLHAFLCVAAARAKVHALALLQYLHSVNCPWDSSTCTTAAECGQIKVLKYAHEHGCPWDVSTSRACAQLGVRECLRYCVERGCPMDEVTMESYNTLNRESENGGYDNIALL